MGKQSFGTLNWLVLIVYLIVMLLIGLSFSKKKFEELTRIFLRPPKARSLLGLSALVSSRRRLAQSPTCRHLKNPF